MGCTKVTLTLCLSLISLFFWACAVTLVTIGAVILSRYGHISELAKSTDVLVPSSIIMGTGVFLFLVGLLGCVGGLKKNKAALTVFFVLTLAVMIGEVIAIAFGYQYREKVHDELTKKLHKMVKECSGNSTATDKKAVCDELDFLQRSWHCCGADTYRDWYNFTSDNASVPESCCKQKGCVTPTQGENTTDIYTKGCADTAIDEVQKYFSWIFVATVIVVILQVLGLVATCIMLFKSEETPYMHLDSQGYRA